MSIEEGLGYTPVDFLGFAFEISSVATKGLLSAANTALLPFIRTVGPKGVIRIGGNTSDLSVWSPDAEARAQTKGTITSRSSVQDLGSFLAATGWNLIWGVNLGQGTEESAADQAAVVIAAAGSHLMGFEIGNEPDLYAKSGLRKPGYSYSGFHRDFVRFADAMGQRTPDIPLAGPDVAVSPDWIIRFAKDEGRRLRLLTGHYYAAGPPESPAATIENLLQPDQRLIDLMRQMETASSRSRVPYRLVEVNSCFGGGKPGLSDTFAAALWGLDLMFMLAASGGAGINWQTGVNQLGFVSSYSPIWDDQHGNYSARPLYYALLAFSMCGIGRRFSVTSNPGAVNLRAWGVIDPKGRPWLTVINKDLHSPAAARVKCPHNCSSADVMELSAPSVDSTSGIRFGDAEVGANGSWQQAKGPTLRIRKGELELQVPPAHASILRFS